MSKKYCLGLTEKQIRLVRDALEEYFRIRMNQWEELADSLAIQDIDLSSDNPRHRQIFDEYIMRRDCFKEVFEALGRVILNMGRTEDQLIAEDIWQVIRHELWKEQENRSEWCVDSREPLQVSHEPLPEIKVLEE